MLALFRSPSLAIATKPSQLLKPIASLRLINEDRARRIRTTASRRSVAINTHEFQPADS